LQADVGETAFDSILKSSAQYRFSLTSPRQPIAWWGFWAPEDYVGQADVLTVW